MAATVAGQHNAAEYTLAGAVFGFSAGKKFDCCLMAEALQAALKVVLHIGVSLLLVVTILGKEE